MGDPPRGLDSQYASRSFAAPRPLRADIPFVVIALASGAVLLYLGRSLTFWEDEWRSITFQGGLLDYLRPVNQHWSTIPLALYRLTFRFVGLHSYLPYLAQVVVLHLGAVAGAYALMRRRLGPLAATLVAIPLLYLGTGAENLFWAFQTGFVGSVLFGVWALFFIERPTRHAAPIASLVLLASLASSGMGVVFLVVAAGRTLFDAALRSRVLAVLPPFMIYGVWFLLVGRDPLGGDQVFVEPGVTRFAVRGVAYSTERLVGLDHLPIGDLWGLALFVGLSLVTGLRIARGRRHGLAAGCLLGVAAMYTVIAFGRLHADPGYDHATSSRYVYVAAFLLVLAVVDLLSERRAWSLRGSRTGVVATAALLLLLALATATNIDALRAKRAEFQATANFTRAFVQVALARGNEPWVERDAPRGWMPSISELERTVERHGSPVEDTFFPGVVEAPPANVQEAALLALVGDGFRVEEPQGGRNLAQVVLGRADGSATTSKAGHCARVRFGPGEAAWILSVPAGARVRVSSRAQLAGRFFLAHEGGPARMIHADFEPGVPRDVVIPDVGDGRLWSLGMDSPDSPAVVTSCVLLADSGVHVGVPMLVVRRWE
jgi:hypothetical protein